jgi:hypothetical protein
MKQQDLSRSWTLRAALMHLSNPWLTLIGERLATPDGQELDYWRIERADSAIIVPIWQHQLILTPPTFRPGIREVTLDFPGGRVPTNQSPLEAAEHILRRELYLEAATVPDIIAINRVGWPINSSLSNQRLFGFWTQLPEALDLSEELPRFPLTGEGVTQLLAVLPCLQCRAVLMALTLEMELEL